MQAQMNNLNNNPIKLINAESTPLISVIIPTYNDSAHVCRAINSVLAQETKNIEIIVIDDCSADNTYQKLNKIYQSNLKVKIYKNKTNIKLGATRNVGINKAKGKYIFFLDSDDWIDKKTLLHLVSISETYKSEIVACGIKKAYEDGSAEKYHSYSFACSGGKEALGYFSDYKIASTVWNKLYKKEYISKHKLSFIDKYWHEDVIFTTNAIFLCKNYISISNEYYNYFQRKSSIINCKPNILHLKSYIKLFTNISDFIEKNNIDTETAQNLIDSHTINNIIPNLLRYNTFHPTEWKRDYIEALKEENINYPETIVEFISSLLTPNCIINTDPQQTNNNFSITNTEMKIINQIRKIKHKIIPQDSIRKKIFEKIKKFRH